MNDHDSAEDISKILGEYVERWIADAPETGIVQKELQEVWKSAGEQAWIQNKC